MKLAKVVSTLVVSVASLALMAAGPAPEPTSDGTPQQPNTYYACPNGYAFQVNNGAARCFQAGTTTTQQTLCVVPGMNKFPDAVGNSDYCKPPGIGAGVAVVCAPGWSLSIRRGLDQCVRSAPPSIRAPTTAVSR